MTPTPQVMYLSGTGIAGAGSFTTLAAAITYFNLRVLEDLVTLRASVNKVILNASTTIASSIQSIASYDISISWSSFSTDQGTAGNYICVGATSTSSMAAVYTSINTALAAEIAAQQGTPNFYSGIQLISADTLEVGAENFAAVVVYSLMQGINA